jgi:hypothetical protein
MAGMAIPAMITWMKLPFYQTAWFINQPFPALQHPGHTLMCASHRLTSCTE